MKLFTFLLVSVMIAGAVVRAAPPPPVLTLHVAQEVEKAPAIDGKLDDACWQSLPPNSTFYRFNKMTPESVPLQTTFQLGYDAKGMYLGIRLFENDMSKIKATITQRGDQNLWTDDSVEIYFDSNATSIGFRKFMLNALATKSSLYRMDPANVDQSWSPDGWQAATSRDDKGWYIEAFFPWNELGKTAKDGDLWRFALCRFSWSANALAASAVGASYTTPERYGWILFLETRAEDVTGLAAQLKPRVPGDWLLPFQDKAILKTGSEVKVTSMGAILAQLRDETRVQLDECKTLVAADTNAVANCEEIATKLSGVTADTKDPVVFQQGVLAFGTLGGQLENLKYAALLRELFATHCSPVKN